MITMQKRLTNFTILTLLFIFFGLTALPSQAANVIVESKDIEPGQSFSLKVYLDDNDVLINTLRVPLKFDSDVLTCLYVDFGGSLKTSDMEGYYKINDGEVEFSYIPPVGSPMPAITADSGLLATIYFSVASDATPTVTSIDSIDQETEYVQYGKSIYVWRKVEFAGDISHLPDFTSGVLSVSSPTDIDDDSDNLLPGQFALTQNYPNPFNPSTKISFSLPDKSAVRLEIFNILGQVVDILADGNFEAGTHEVTWDASGVPSGIYFYKLSAGSESMTKKMLFLK